MANRRSQNWLNQQRVDVPHLRSIESAVRNDFDELFSSLVMGENSSYVVRGFEIGMAGAIGSSASSLQLIVANSSFLHGASNESGTFFEVGAGTPNETLNSTTNDRIDGSFTPSTLNYIGLEFTREIDNSTAGLIYLWNPSTKSEITKTLPLAITLDYKVVVTSSIWASNVMPLAIVETDGSNNAIRVEDRRPMLLRLGAAGSSTPDPFHNYPWTEGRDENPFSSTSATSPFEGGDKQLLHLKDWMDATMSSIKEIKGTPYWYSDNTVGGSIIKLRGDLAHTQMTGSGIFTHAESTAGQINWSSDVFLNFIGSRLKYKLSANAATTDIILSDNQVSWIKIVRDQDIAPNLIFINGSVIVESVGSVSWTSDVLPGDFIKVKLENDTKYYEIDTIPNAYTVNLTEIYSEPTDYPAGTQATYAYGFYETNVAPSTDRHIKVDDRKDVPLNEDTYWLFFRTDDGGATAKVYIRGSSGGELEQGESREISDNTADQVLEYIGSPSEADALPDYTNSIITSVAEQTRFTFPAAASLITGQYFEINSANDRDKYYAWANIDAGGGDPAPGGRASIEVAISSGDNALTVAAAFHAAINAIGDFNSVDNFDNSITVTNSKVGSTTDAANVDMGAGFSITLLVDGVGKALCAAVDDENLTKTAKRLDEAVCDLQAQLDSEPYEEKMAVVAGAPADDNEIQGDVTALTTITIPKNSRDGNIQEVYIVGSGELQVYLNGHKLCEGADYNEIGTAGNESTTIENIWEFKTGDVLTFLLANPDAGAGSSGTANGVNLGTAKDADVFKQNAGDQIQFRRLSAGAGITITENAEDISFSSSAGVAPSTVVSISGVNYGATSNDDVVLVSNSGSNVTITLPTATAAGKVFNIKKIDSGNTLIIKSISNQTLDGVDIDTTPHAITIQNESITIVSGAGNWWVI